jgi:hypothetical protein
MINIYMPIPNPIKEYIRLFYDPEIDSMQRRIDSIHMLNQNIEREMDSINQDRKFKNDLNNIDNMLPDDRNNFIDNLLQYKKPAKKQKPFKYEGNYPGSDKPRYQRPILPTIKNQKIDNSSLYYDEA